MARHLLALLHRSSSSDLHPEPKTWAPSPPDDASLFPRFRRLISSLAPDPPAPEQEPAKGSQKRSKRNSSSLYPAPAAAGGGDGDGRRPEAPSSSSTTTTTSSAASSLPLVPRPKARPDGPVGRRTTRLMEALLGVDIDKCLRLHDLRKAIREARLSGACFHLPLPSRFRVHGGF